MFIKKNIIVITVLLTILIGIMIREGNIQTEMWKKAPYLREKPSKEYLAKIQGNFWQNSHWIDLGVFSGNKNAKALFEKVGFKKIGYMEDCWLIDGKSISTILMSINVK